MSSSVLPRALEQRLQHFFCQAAKKVAWGRFFESRQCKVAWQVCLSPGFGEFCNIFLAAVARGSPVSGPGRTFPSDLFLLLPSRTAPSAPSLQESQPLTLLAATVSRAPVGWCGADRSATIDRFWTGTVLQDSSVLSLFPGAVVWGMRGFCDHGGLVPVLIILCQQNLVPRYLVVITVILVVAVVFLVNYFFHLHLLTFTSPYW